MGSPKGGSNSGRGWGFEQVADHRRQVGEDLGAGRQAACLEGLLAFARQNQVGRAAADEAGLQVAQRVAHGGHAAQRHFKTLGDFLEHAGLGLPAIAVVDGGMGAKKMASIWAPAICACVCSFWWMLFRMVMSNSSRAMPDWFEATTTR